METRSAAVTAAVSSRVARVDARNCPSLAREQTNFGQVTHAVVFEAGTIRGVVRLDETVRTFPDRTFAEFLPAGPPIVIPSGLSLEELARRFAENNLDAAIVVDQQGEFVGVVTSQSLLAALIEQRNIQKSTQQDLLYRYLRLAHMGRINTMGEMASGLSHELNQPLTAIVAYVDACLELVETGRMTTAQLADVLRSVSSQAERAGQIIHRLRKMVKRNQPESSIRSMNEAVREVAELMESVMKQSDIAIELDLAEDLPEIPIDFLQVQQVILHLVDNGCDAMRETPLDKRRLVISTRRYSEFEIETAVCDQGSGLTDEAASRLFESFFSTKADGMGLGLSTSRTIIESHGGRIWITPNSTVGVTARFILPINHGKAAHGRESHRIHS